MSHATNSNVSSLNFCDVSNFSIETKKGLHRHQSYDSKYNELLDKLFFFLMKRECLIRKEILSMPNLLLKLKLKITLRILLKLNPVLKLKLKSMIVSTPELSMNVKNVMKN